MDGVELAANVKTEAVATVDWPPLAPPLPAYESMRTPSTEDALLDTPEGAKFEPAHAKAAPQMPALAHAEQRPRKAAAKAAQRKAAEQGAIAAAKLFASASPEFRLAAAAEAAKRRESLLDADSSTRVGATDISASKANGGEVLIVEAEMRELADLRAWKKSVEQVIADVPAPIAGVVAPTIEAAQQQQQVPAAVGIKARIAERKAMTGSSTSLDSPSDSQEAFADALCEPTPQAAARAWLLYASGCDDDDSDVAV